MSITGNIAARATSPDTLALDSENQIPPVVRQIEQLQARNSRAQNASLPINTLPRELLSLVWTDVIYDSALASKDAVWTLAQVSKLWANILLTSSEMWCDISSAFSQKRIGWALKKSAGRQLRIFLGAERNVADIFNMVVPERHRWAELRFTAGLPRLISALRTVSLPRLESAVFRMNRHNIWPTIEPPNLIESPGLHRLELDTTPLNWLSPSTVPKGIRSLNIRCIQGGPFFPQLVALLSETTLLEELQLERLGFPQGGQSASSRCKPQSLVLPHLRKLLIFRVEGTLPSLLLSSIRADNCRSLMVAPFNPALSRNSSRGLRAFLAPMAPFTEMLVLNISNSSRSGYAVLSTLDEPDAFAPRAGVKTTGFTVGFPLGPNYENLPEILSLLAYTPTPISISVHSMGQSDQTVITELDWDQLPSLRELTINYPFDPSPILFSLCKPRGPRESPRWPCPQLTVLRLSGLEYPPPGFCGFLEQRWGPPEADGLQRDASRPAKLSLCQAPMPHIAELLSREQMAQFADAWEDSALPLQTGPTVDEDDEYPW